ncbi:MAG: hypothetical protein NZ824_11670 [Candidatus Thioglobus sp.]|nr:hypothetical protein [Candidatus Thioglobus sp.]
MKLKTLLLTLSLILAGFIHSAFGFYGVDLGKLKVIEDSSKNQDSINDYDYNDVIGVINPKDTWVPKSKGGIFYNPQRFITNPLWKNTNTTNPNPFGGIFNTINSNIPDKDNNDLGIRYQRDMDGNKILGISKDTPDGGIQNNRINAIHTNARELDLNQEDNSTAKQPATQLQFVNGEWVEASGNPEARVTDTEKIDPNKLSALVEPSNYTYVGAGGHCSAGGFCDNVALQSCFRSDGVSCMCFESDRSPPHWRCSNSTRERLENCLNGAQIDEDKAECHQRAVQDCRSSARTDEDRAGCRQFVRDSNEEPED